MGAHLSRKKWRAGVFERRRYTRYYFSDNEARVFSHSCKNFGWITDISRGGLSFEYIPTEKLDIEKEIIDIFNYSGNRIFLPGISCQKIYEIDESEKYRLRSPAYFVRRGLKCDFTERQAARLEELITSLETMSTSCQVMVLNNIKV